MDGTQTFILIIVNDGLHTGVWGRKRCLDVCLGPGKNGRGKNGPGKNGLVKTVVVKTVLGKKGPGKKGPR